MKFLSSRGRQSWTRLPKFSNSRSWAIFLSTGLKASRMMWHPAQNTFMILFYFFGIAPQGGARKGHVVRLENKLRLCFTDRPQTKPRILETLWSCSTIHILTPPPKGVAVAARQSWGLFCDEYFERCSAIHVSTFTEFTYYDNSPAPHGLILNLPLYVKAPPSGNKKNVVFFRPINPT